MKTINVAIPEELYQRAEATLQNRRLTVETFVRVALRGALQKNGYVPLTAELPFGKYRGETLETVVRADPDYVRWLLTNSKNFTTDEAAIELLEVITGTAEKKARGKRKKKDEAEVETELVSATAPKPGLLNWLRKPPVN